MGTSGIVSSRALMLLLLVAPAPVAAGCSCDGALDPTVRTGDGGRADGAPRVDGEVLPGEDIVLFGPGAPSDSPIDFMDPPSASSAGRADILYPLDGVLLPRNVFSPDVQWSTGGAVAGDIYRVRFTGAPIELTAYVLHSGAGFRYDYLVDYPAWQRLTAIGAGQTLALTVDRWDSARREVVRGNPVSVRIARSGIAGAVYYWQLGEFGTPTEGRVLRVRQGTEIAPVIENFMPQPPPAADGARCAACHGLSRDGNRLAVALDDGTFGGVFDLTADLTGADPPMVFRFDRDWFFAAFNPDATRLFMTDTAQGAFLLDGNTGAELAPSSGALPGGTHPAWSPDGNQLALIVNADDAWNPQTGDLATLSVLGADSFGGASVLHSGAALAGSPEGGNLDAYPTHSPDSLVIAFQHGTRTLVSAGDATGALYVIPRGGGAATRLTNASGGSAYYPNFTPFAVLADDGTTTYWLLHYSQRDYGNELAGTQGTRRRQIWVSAVSADLTRPDPSNVPYWLPGQDISQENASAYWAPVPCRATGDSCTDSGQCCTEVCGPDGPVDTCRPPTSCRMLGTTCSTSSDCCGSDAGAVCQGNVCISTFI